MARKITVDLLESVGACDEQIDAFKEHFPDGTEVTVELAVSVANVFDWEWAAHAMLIGEGHKAFRDACALAHKTWYQSKIQTYKSLNRSTDIATPGQYWSMTVYAEMMRPIDDKFRAEMATAWALAWLSQESTETKD